MPHRCVEDFSGADTLWATGKKVGRSKSDHKPAKSLGEEPQAPSSATAAKPGKPSSLLDTRVVYCGDNLEQLAKLPDACADLIEIDPLSEEIEQSFNSNHNYEVFWGEWYCQRRLAKLSA